MGILGTESRRVVAAICGRAEHLTYFFGEKARWFYPLPPRIVFLLSTHSFTAMFFSLPAFFSSPRLFSWPPTAGGAVEMAAAKILVFFSPLVCTHSESIVLTVRACTRTGYPLGILGLVLRYGHRGRSREAPLCSFFPSSGVKMAPPLRPPPTLKDITD